MSKTVKVPLNILKTPLLADIVTSKVWQRSILSGKTKFPIKTQPANHLKGVMEADMVQPEKCFRAALKRQEYDFARRLLDSEIVPVDMDLLFNCCSDHTDEALEMIAPILADEAQLLSLPSGIWKKALHDCLHSLFLGEEFTQATEDAAMKLAKLCDINVPYLGTSNIFVHLVMHRPAFVTPKRVKAMIAAGICFTQPRLSASSPTTATTLGFLTHGIEINTLIEILSVIRDAKC